MGGRIPVGHLDFRHAGWWLTPERATRRYDTHFFLARYRGGRLVPDRAEITDAWWERPIDVLRRIYEGSLDAIFPTIEFLRALSACDSADSVFKAASRSVTHPEGDGWVGF